MIRKVEIAGVNTAKLPVLSNEEKQELLVKIKNGDNEAREKFISRKFKISTVSHTTIYADVEKTWMIYFKSVVFGLIKAIDNFDITQNVQFSTYAVPMIIGEVRRYLRDNNSIRVSRSIRDLAYKAIQFKEKYIKENNKEPTLQEIAKELGVEKEEIAFSLDAIQDPVSLQEPIYNDGSESIYVMDQVKDTKNTDELWAENMTMMQAMSKLNDKERNIIVRRYFDGRTQMEVADEIGISQAQVSRLEKSAINHIKKLYK